MGIIIVSLFLCYFAFCLYSDLTSNRRSKTTQYADKTLLLTDEGIPKSDIPSAKKNQESSNALKTPPVLAQVQPARQFEIINEEIINEEIERRGLSVSNSTPTPSLEDIVHSEPQHFHHSVPPTDYGTSKYTNVSEVSPSYSPYFHLLNKKLEPRINDLVQQLFSRIPKGLCIACGERAEGENGVRLSNGMFIHRSCHAELITMLQTIKSDAGFPSSRSKQYELLLRLIIANQFWPTYPHDWEQRKYIVMLRDEHECNECGEESLPLHIHHITSISVGGDHLLENLQTLCEDCHNDAHDGHLSNVQRKGKNRTLIDTAFNQGKNLKMIYKDTRGQYTGRVVKPLHYEKAPQGAPALRAYCFLRKDKRLFIIRKMSKVEVV